MKNVKELNARITIKKTKIDISQKKREKYKLWSIPELYFYFLRTKIAKEYCKDNYEYVKDIPHERDLLDNTYFQLENAKQETQKEFPKEQELQEKLRKLEEINAELKINEDDHEMLGDEKEEKQDKSPDKNSPERC